MTEQERQDARKSAEEIRIDAFALYYGVSRLTVEFLSDQDRLSDLTRTLRTRRVSVGEEN